VKNDLFSFSQVSQSQLFILQGQGTLQFEYREGSRMFRAAWQWRTH